MNVSKLDCSLTHAQAERMKSGTGDHCSSLRSDAQSMRRHSDSGFSLCPGKALRAVPLDYIEQLARGVDDELKGRDFAAMLREGDELLVQLIATKASKSQIP